MTDTIFALAYKTLCKINTDKNNPVWAGECDITAITALNTDENVRDFLALSKGKRYTRVHRDIEATLHNEPENFHLLNGGLTLICDDLKVDAENNNIQLTNPSIINGAQTQGVIKDFLAQCETEEKNTAPSHCTH